MFGGSHLLPSRMGDSQLAGNSFKLVLENRSREGKEKEEGVSWLEKESVSKIKEYE